MHDQCSSRPARGSRTRSIIVALGLVATAGSGLAGCAKADLVVANLEVTDYTADTLTYEFAVENIDYGDKGFVYPGSIDGRVGFDAYCSSDGIEKDGPSAGYDSVRIVNPTLLPGELQDWKYTSTVKIDIEAWPYLLVTVDPEDAVIEYDEKNNSMAVRIEP
ncbi:MAG: hypothetical protein GY715_13605 [Planctomycetes bacterium]|nr:hypothetical protein [Planctomycetota bacterium]